MALRLLHALAGVILGYGLATGPFFFNLVFDIGAVFALLALGLAVAVERSLRTAWPLLLVTAAFPALVGLHTLGLPNCGATLTYPGTACLAEPESRQITIVALIVVAFACGLGVWDVRRAVGPRSGSTSPRP
jgi:hypothetical protein